MRSRELRCKPRGTKKEAVIEAEEYRSPQELRDVCLGRKCRFNEEEDYFDSEVTPDCPHWTGVRTNEEMMERFRDGSEDAKLVSDVKAYAYKAQCQSKDKLRQPVRRVSGGSVDVPRFMLDIPECMWSMAHRRVNTRIIDMSVDISVVCGTGGDEYAKAGGSICRVIAKLEKAGYRIRLHAVSNIWCDDYTGPKGNHGVLLDLMLKREFEPMNYRRVIYALSDISFFRGICFGWMVRNPDMPKDCCLGTEIRRGLVRSHFTHAEIDEVLDQTYTKLYGHRCVQIVMADLISQSRSGDGQAELEKKIEAQCLGL